MLGKDRFAARKSIFYLASLSARLDLQKRPKLHQILTLTTVWDQWTDCVGLTSAVRPVCSLWKSAKIKNRFFTEELKCQLFRGYPKGRAPKSKLMSIYVITGVDKRTYQKRTRSPSLRAELELPQMLSINTHFRPFHKTLLKWDFHRIFIIQTLVIKPYK